MKLFAVFTLLVHLLTPAPDLIGGVIFIGDSYVLTSHWPDYAAEYAGIEKYYVSAAGGTGFVNTPNVRVGDELKPTNFLTLLEDAYYAVGDEDYRWIIVEGGYNDQYYGEDEILPQIRQFCDMAREYFPNAQVVIGVNAWHQDYEEIRHMIQNARESYKKGAEQNGAWFLEGLEYVLRDQDVFANDHFHPKEAGGKLLGEYTGQYLMDAVGIPEEPEKEKSHRAWVIYAAVGIVLVTAGSILYRRRASR